MSELKPQYVGNELKPHYSVGVQGAILLNLRVLLLLYRLPSEMQKEESPASYIICGYSIFSLFVCGWMHMATNWRAWTVS